MAAQPALVADVLLQWIYAQAGGADAALVTLIDFYPDVKWPAIDKACRNLEDQKLITVSWNRGLPYIRPTADGISRAEQSYRRWTDRTFRNRAARDRLLAWLYDEQGNQQAYIHISKFFYSSESIVEGYFLSSDDVDAAVRYLSGRGLVDSKGSDEFDHRTSLIITLQGIECVERGGIVAEHVAPREDHTIYNFTGPISGGYFSMGVNPTQQISNSGIDSDSLRILAETIIRALPSLQTGQRHQDNVKDTAKVIITETSQRAPDRRALHAGLKKLRELLAIAGNHAFAAAIDYELGKLGFPPTG